jgi:hypothetical protein
MNDEVIKIYEREEEINLLVERLRQFSFDSFIKTKHFFYSLDEKGQNIEFLKEKFNEFERIKLIAKRKHKNDKISYDFYYLLDDNSYILYAIALDEEKPIMLNAFQVQRNFRHFRNALIKAYKDKLIG